MNILRVNQPKHILFFLAILIPGLLTGCPKDYGIIVKDYKQDKTVEEINLSYHKPKHGFEFIKSSMEMGQYDKALIHGQFFIQTWGDEEDYIEAVEGLVILASVLRMETVEAPGIEKIYQNNGYIEETIKLIVDIAKGSPNDIVFGWNRMLRQGSIHTQPFYNFMESLRNLCLKNKRAQAYRENLIKEQDYEWYQKYHCQILIQYYKEQFTDEG